jgi:hypothetical protein
MKDIGYLHDMTKRFCRGKKRTNKMLPEVSFWGLVGIMRTIAFMQSLRIGNVFSPSCM